MTPGDDTIFALSSGSPPAAIAVVRISGSKATSTLEAMAGALPSPRLNVLRTLVARDATVLDRALVHWAAGPATATGEDVAELHLHGGRAVVAAMLRELEATPGLRMALPGEFTRRALLNGRIDLAEAEGLADLLAAETETQRRHAVAQVGGAFGRLVEGWRVELLSLSATIEAHIEYGEEDDLGPAPALSTRLSELAVAMRLALARPPSERLRDGIRVVIAGPPNAGKSTLLNALVGREAAIVSPTPGTTRDVIEAPVVIDGIPFLLADTAGLRETDDQIENEGVDRALRRAREADILVWLGSEDEGPAHSTSIRVHAKADIMGAIPSRADVAISATTGLGLGDLTALITVQARALLPRENVISLNARQRRAVADVVEQIELASGTDDELILADHMRAALTSIDIAIGRTAPEDMLDALFGQFCIGK